MASNRWPFFILAVLGATRVYSPVSTLHQRRVLLSVPDPERLPPLHTEHLADLPLDVPFGLFVFQVHSLMALDSQTEQLVIQPVPVARLGHVYTHDARALGTGHVEVHAKMRRPVAICLGRVREGPGARPLVGGGFTVGGDFPGRTEEGATLGGRLYP